MYRISAFFYFAVTKILLVAPIRPFITPTLEKNQKISSSIRVIKRMLRIEFMR